MKHIVVIGVGALGSNLLLAGRNLPVTWTIVDMDRVEKKNTLSQFHTNQGIGKNKAVALQAALQGLFGLKANPNPNRLTETNVEAILGTADIIVECLDNAASRQIVQNYARHTGKPCLHSAVAAKGAYGRVVWDQNFVIDAETVGVPTCEDGEHLPFIMTVGSQIAEVLRVYLRTGKQVQKEISPTSIRTI